VDHATLSQLVSDFVPLNRRRMAGDASLTVLDLERWGELRDLLAYEFGYKPHLGPGGERALRVPAHLKARYGETGEEGVLCNLSEGGVFVQCARVLAPGTPIRLYIEPAEGDEAIEVGGVVAWSRELPNLDGPTGFGVSFQGLGAAEMIAIGELIERALREFAGS